MKITTLAGLALASLSLGACAGLPLTGNPAADAKTAAANISAVNTNITNFNGPLLTQIIDHCSIKGELNVAIPNPVPTGNLKVVCDIEPGGMAAPTPTTTLGLSSAAIGNPAVASPAPASK